jgi:riboflavin kinase/FMN adenylyltransferase
MQHVHTLEDLSVNKPSMVTIGVFDGLHRGHQYLIKSLVAEAHKRDLLAGVMTFHPHPDEVLQGPKGRYYLTTVEERAALMAELRVDYLVTHPFNQDVMQIRAADFVQRLANHMKLACLWVGENFALGHKREGNVAFLTIQGQRLGFEVNAIPLVDTTDHVVNSTAIRKALAEADVETANSLLGRSYSVQGEVIHGMKRGRKLGFPTANLALPDDKLIPALGVYAGWATVKGERYMAATNIGYSPTFGNKDVTVEAYLLDFDQDIYGKTLHLTFETYLRPEMKFDGIEALIAQMTQDVATGRAFLMERQSS